MCTGIPRGQPNCKNWFKYWITRANAGSLRLFDELPQCLAEDVLCLAVLRMTAMKNNSLWSRIPHGMLPSSDICRSLTPHTMSTTDHQQVPLKTPLYALSKYTVNGLEANHAAWPPSSSPARACPDHWLRVCPCTDRRPSKFDRKYKLNHVWKQTPEGSPSKVRGRHGFATVNRHTFVLPRCRESALVPYRRLPSAD